MTQEIIKNIELTIKNAQTSIEEIGKIVKDAIAQIEELKNSKPVAKRFIPKHDEAYWYIDYTGKAVYECYSAHSARHDYAYYTGNCYRTKAEAQEVIDKSYAIIHQQIKDIALELNNGEEIDWENNTPKYYLYINCGELGRYHTGSVKIEGTIYCLSENFLDECIKRIDKEKLLDYLKNS